MKLNPSALRRYAHALLMALAAAACGSSARTPTAAATPTPAPAATPAPASAPQAFSCFLPAMKDLHNQCPKPGSQLVDHVNSAIDTVIQKQPELFDFTDTLGGSPKVLDRQKYQTAVVAAINAQGGICAKDDNEEVAVKVTNDYNEQFNIWTSSGYTRRSYITTCFPAQF
jgi:hypothetical protein